MEIQFYGANCVRLTTKKAAIIVDDTTGSFTKIGDIQLFTNGHNGAKTDAKIVIDVPGEYEVSDTSINGIAARAHMDEEGKRSATMFKLVVDDVRVAVLGHVYPDLSEEQLEAFGTIDLLVVPVGGNGYTLDAIGALKLIKKIDPKIVIPTHYADKAVAYEVPQQSLEEVLKALAMEPKETVDKLKLKSGEMGDTTQLIVLENSRAA